jgi:uncharacterized protein YbaR (Trm112 family)
VSPAWGVDGEHGLPSLVCPTCRHARDGALHVRTLARDGGILRCACGAAYPVVDDVPLVLRELDRWLAEEGVEALRRPDLPPEVEARLLAGARGAGARNTELVSVYERSRAGALQAWLTARVDALPGRVLEIGAGLGASARTDVIALDLNLGLVRRHPGPRLVADAADPPFLPHAFDAVVLPNLLDSCAHPALVLAQADALLRPGGTLIVTCAYAFRDDITPLAARFSPQALQDALDGRAPLGGYSLPHRIVESRDDLEWPLRVTERLLHVHRVQALISVKAA